MPGVSRPRSQSARALAVLVDAPGREFSTGQVADALGIGREQEGARHRLGATLATRWRTAAVGTDWRRVHRTSSGGWVFRPDFPERPRQAAEPRSGSRFTQVGQEGETVVLQGPDGRLWVARPLVDAVAP